MSASDPLVRRSSTALRYPEWQRPYQAALLELDPKRVIQGAIYALKILKRESLNFPDWESGSGGTNYQHGDRCGVTKVNCGNGPIL